MSESVNDPLLVETVEVIARFCKREVTPDTHLIADLALDSLDIAELVAELEDHFNVVVPMERLPELRTVGDIARSLSTLVEREQLTRSL